MNMRTQKLNPKIYNHRINTLAKENGLENREIFQGVYEELAGCIFAYAYYEYNYPVRPYLCAILSLGSGPIHVKRNLQENGNSEGLKAFEILLSEFESETIRLFSEHVNKETRSPLGKISPMQEQEQISLFKELKARWGEPSLPQEPLPGTIVFKNKPGRRIGCSGGGACTQCTHPTCGKAYN